MNIQRKMHRTNIIGCARMSAKFCTLTTKWKDNAGLPFLDFLERSQGNG